MNDIAHLTMAVDSTDTDKAAKSLDNLADFAEKAEKATGALGHAVQKNAKEYKSLSEMADDLANSERRAVEQIHQRSRAYTQSAGAGVAAMRAAEKNAQSMSQYATETEKLRAGLAKLLATIDPLEARLNRLDEAEEKLTQTFKRGIIDADKYAESLAKIGAQRNDIAEKNLKEIGNGAEYAAGMMKKLSLDTRLVQQDLMNLGRAAAGVAASSMVLLGAAYYQGYQRTQEFNRSIAITGNTLGISAAEMAYMTTEVGRLSGSYAQAERAANLIARSGRIASDSIQDVMKTAVGMQNAFGQSVDETIGEFERLGDSPSRALMELDEKYRFLTAAVLEQVLALEEQGRAEEAAAVAQAHYSEQLEIRAAEVIENVGSVERAWLTLRGVVVGTWEAIANIGKDKTLEQSIAGVTAEMAAHVEMIEALEKAGANSDDRGLRRAEAALQALKERRSALEATLKIQQEEAKAAERERKNEDAERERIKSRNSYLKTHTQPTLASELAKANEELKQVTAGLDKESTEYAKVMEAHYSRVEQINKKYEKSTRGGSSASGNQFAAEVARLKARIAEEKDLSKALEGTISQVTRLNQFERKAMQLREQASKETKAGTKAKLEQLAALNEEAGALVRNNKLSEEATKERLKYLDGLEKSTKSTYDEAQKLRDQAQTMGMSRMALEALTTARIEEQITQLQNNEGSEEEIELLREQIAARHELSEAIGQHEMARSSHQAQQELEREWQQTVDNIDDVFRRGFADMLNEGKGSWASFTKSLTTTFKTAVANEIYKMFAQPFVVRAAVTLTGALGLGGAAQAQGSGGANPMDMVSGINSAWSAYSGGLTNTLATGVGKLGETFGSSALTSFANGLGSAAMSGALTSAVGTSVAASGLTGVGGSLTIGSGAAASLGTSAVTGAATGGAAGLGATVGAALPYIGAAFAAYTLASSLFGGKGETRVGGHFHRQQGGQAQFIGGPSGGYGGTQTVSAMDEVLKGATDTVDRLFEALDVIAKVDYFGASFEGSDKGRGGTQSNAGLYVGGEYMTVGSVGKGSGYGGTSGSPEEMFENMVGDMQLTILEAWQTAADQMPSMIGDMLSGLDVRSLNPEQAGQIIGEIEAIVGAVTTLSAALERMPIANLTGLAFDATASLISLMGGLEGATTQIGAYYENFYKEAEKAQHTTDMLTQEFGRLNMAVPDSREAFRELVNGLDLTAEDGRTLYAELLGLSGAFASVVEWTDELGNSTNNLQKAAQERSALEQQLLDVERQLLEIAGDTEAIRRMDLTALSQTNHALQEHVWALQSEASAATAAAAAARSAAQERQNLEMQILRLQGDTTAIRQAELSEVDESNRALQEKIWALQDEAAANQAAQQAAQRRQQAAQQAAQAAQQAAQAEANARQNLERQILQLQGDTAAIRQLELSALSSSNQLLQERIWALQDEAAVAQERLRLEDQLLQIQGDTAQLRQLDLDKLDKSNHALQKRIWHLQDEATAAQALEAAQQSRTQERLSLEMQILQLQGDTAAIRAIELSKLDASNRALQLHIWTLEDHAAAVERARQREADALRESISKIGEKLGELNSLSSAIDAGLDSLRGFSDVATQMHRAASRDIVAQATKMAQAGKSLAGFDGLTDAVGALSRLETSDFTSLFDYEMERAESANALRELGNLTDGQIDVQELQLAALETQLERLDTWKDAQLGQESTLFEKEQAELDRQFRTTLEQLQFAQAEQEDQVNRLTEWLTLLFERGWEYQDNHHAETIGQMQSTHAHLTRIELAITRAASQIAAASATAAAAAVSASNSYSSTREFDEWINKVQANQPGGYLRADYIDRARAQFEKGRALPESNPKVSAYSLKALEYYIRGYATGGRYPGGLALVGEEGPELINFSQPGMVYTAAQSRNLMANAGVGADETAGLLRQLVGEIREMRHELRQIAVNTQKTNKMLDDVTQGGTTLRTEVFDGAD